MNEEYKFAVDNIIKWKNGEKIYPYQLLIIPTNGCNLNCLSCLARGQNPYIPTKELGEGASLRLIKEATKLKIKFCEIAGGGEPLFAYKKTTSIMRLLKKKRIKSKIFTNGTIFKNNFLKEMVEISWDIIHFSIDGPNEETHDYIRGKGTFSKTISNIKKINSWKQKLRKRKPEIIMATVITHQNHNMIENMISLCNELQVHSIYFQAMQIRNKDIGKKIELAKNDYKSFFISIKRAQKMASVYNIDTNLSQLDRIFIEKSSDIKKLIEIDSRISCTWYESIPCFHPWTNITINAYGQIGVCPSLAQNSTEYEVGLTSLEEFWYSKELSKLRNSFVKNKIPKICSTCCGNVVLSNREIRGLLRKKLKE